MSSTCNTRPGRAESGFTLFEVLVALAVMAVSLTAIGSLVAVNIRATWRLDQRLTLVETTRAIIAGLPDRAHLDSANFGDTANHRWRIAARPFTAGFISSGKATPWIPQAVVLNVQSPSGRVLRIDTIRLRRSAGTKK